jgi:hypothetical protein
VLDRVFRDLDDEDSGVRGKASEALDRLRETALAGVRERASKTTSAEARRRADTFLSRHAMVTLVISDRLRIERAMEVLAVINTPAAQKLVATLAKGAGGTWMTEAAQRIQTRMMVTAAQ